MLCKTAKADLDSLRVCGFKPTDDEIIQLNDLALRIEQGKELTPQNAPRFAICGNVILHEPTVMGQMWWMDYGKDAFFLDDWRLKCYFFMLANSRNEDLKKLTVGNEIRKAVKKWARNCCATESELWRGLMWVKYADKTAHEQIENEIETTIEDDEKRTALWMSLIAASGALGLPPESLETKTRSELNGLLIQANMMARIPMKQSVASDYIAYRQILRRIEDRGN